MTTTCRSLATAATTALLLLTAACSSSGSVTGRNLDTSRPAAPSASTSRSSTPTADPAPSDPAPSSTPESTDTSDGGSSAPATPTASASATDDVLCGSESNVIDITTCLKGAISDFWSGELNNVVSEPVYVTPSASSVPSACRPGLDEAPAFTCRSNLSLYINQGLLDTVADHVAAKDWVYAYASVQSHEIGHVLQYTLHQPQIESGDDSEANSRFLEQQADCLSGVWAAHVTGGFDKAAFRRVSQQLITLVSSNPEIATHGTPAQRVAAIDRGLASGRPQSCRLATFS